ncbi:unnamed protein product (mitochondrion) [Musa textilis]
MIRIELVKIQWGKRIGLLRHGREFDLQKRGSDEAAIGSTSVVTSDLASIRDSTCAGEKIGDEAYCYILRLNGNRSFISSLSLSFISSLSLLGIYCWLNTTPSFEMGSTPLLPYL